MKAHNVGGRPGEQVRPHVAAQVAVGDHADQARALHHARAAEALAAHDDQGVAHGIAGPHQRQRVAAMHDVARRQQGASQRTAGMKLMEVLGLETPRREQPQSHGVAQGHLHGGGGGGGAAYGAGLGHVGQQQHVIGVAAQKTLRVLGYGHHGHAVPGGEQHDIRQFDRFAGIGKSQDRVADGHHAQIAVTGLSRVNEIGGRAGGRQSGGYLGGHMTTFAHAGHGNATLNIQQTGQSLVKGGVQAGRQHIQGVGLLGQNAARQGKGTVFHASILA